MFYFHIFPLVSLFVLYFNHWIKTLQSAIRGQSQQYIIRNVGKSAQHTNDRGFTLQFLFRDTPYSEVIQSFSPN